ncbi:Peptidase S10, serine carboxypeptidase [Artemisia annua]|uniref:Carboxypeptidase n=1 Tax=Artemisia annua TaxID=35608 RepID=A0A2U1LT52_ARTAN|nr:Peptidase S10, serine carboxypeptidase [Artemisia annua]
MESITLTLIKLIIFFSAINRYLTINSTTGSAIFYVFYEAKNLNNLSLSQVPLLIWLQGGPGCSSMTGNFFELGPYLVTSSLKHNVEHLTLKKNPSSWNRLFGLLFLDNPIGTGFSIASTYEEIPRDQENVAKHLSIAIKKFISLNTFFETRPVYITGESYAGKYVPSIGYYIAKRNKNIPVSERVNLCGLAIGNGLTDPITQVKSHAKSAYYLGLINRQQRTHLEKLQLEVVRLTKDHEWYHATNARSKLLNVLQNMSGLATLYDFRRLTSYEITKVTSFLSNNEIKKILKANESVVYEACSPVVGSALHEDLMQSVRYMIEYLLNDSDVKILLYTGQCDLRVGVVGIESWVKKMKWDGVKDYMESKREVWMVNGQLAGYVQKYGNLVNVVVFGAGHLVPADQSVNSQAMIEDWVLENGLFGNEKMIERHFDQQCKSTVVGVDYKCIETW